MNISRLLRTCAVVLVTLTAAAAQAQRGEGRPASRPGWLPRLVEIGGGTTPAQRAEAIARLEAIERLLLQVPALANPEGFEIQAWFQGGARRLGPGGTERKDNVVEYMLSLIFFVPSMAIAHEGCGCITIRVNPLTDPGERAITDESGRAFWVESPRGEPIPGTTQVQSRLSPTEPSHVYVLLTPGRAVPWREATREEYYNAWIWETDGKDASGRAVYQASLEKTRYQEWLEGVEQRRKEREELLKAMAAAQPAAEVAKLRKTLEDTERAVTEQLKASDAEDRESNKAALAGLNSRSAAIRAELESMSADERRKPALVDGDMSEGRTAIGIRVVDRDGPLVRRVLTPDYDYWRARRSPVEARGIQVHIGVSGSGTQPPVHRALWQAFNTLDWAALYRLLEAPR